MSLFDVLRKIDPDEFTEAVRQQLSPDTSEDPIDIIVKVMDVPAFDGAMGYISGRVQEIATNTGMSVEEAKNMSMGALVVLAALVRFADGAAQGQFTDPTVQ